MSIKERTTVNRPLLLKTLAYIEEHPENWNQSHWAGLHPDKAWIPDDICGTSFCFAGHAMASEGYVPFFYQSDLDSGYTTTDNFISLKEAKKLRKGTVTANEVDLVDVESGAKHLLGLSSDQANSLFDANNELTDLREKIAKLITLDDEQQEINLNRGYASGCGCGACDD